MALPPGIQAKTVTLGIASFADGSLATGRATVSLAVNVLHTPSNRPIFSSDITKPFVDGMVSFDLLPTDAPGLNRVDFSYALRVEIQGANVQPEVLHFVLPTNGPDVVDLDGLVTVPSSAGVPISVDVLTTEDLPGVLAEEIADETSATFAALQEAFDAWGGDAAGAKPPALVKFDAALATAHLGPRPVVFVGSSTTASNPGFVTPLVTAMQAAYPSGLGSESTVQVDITATFGTVATSAGVHGYNAGEGGTDASDYLTADERTRIAALAPVAVFHMVGSNDYEGGIAAETYRTNLLAVVDGLKALLPATSVQVLVHSYQRLDPGVGGVNPVPWSEYGRIMREVAEADPASLAFLDLSDDYTALGIPGTDPLDLIGADDTHQTTAGYAVMVELLAKHLGLPGPRRAAAAAATPAVGVTRTAARYTSDALSGGDVADIVGRTTDALLGGTGKPWVGAAGTLRITSGKIVKAGTALIFAGFAQPHPDVELSAVAEAVPTVQGVYLDVRRAEGAGVGSPDAYRLWIQTNGTLRIQKRVGGALTSLGTAFSFAVGDRVAVRCYKSTVSMVRNGEVLWSGTDTSVVSGGFAGIAGAASGTSTLSLSSVTLDVIT